MAKKAKEKTKKERTIVREFIETRFKEIKSEKNEEVEEESELEKDTKLPESSEEESFSDFSVSNRAFISLKSDESQGNLERTAETAPSIKREAGAEENSADLYSSKKYNSNYDNEKYSTMEISPSLLSTSSKDSTMKDLFSRRDPQTQFQDRFAETWQDNRREERQYEPIVNKSNEEDRGRLEKRRRSIMG